MVKSTNTHLTFVLTTHSSLVLPFLLNPALPLCLILFTEALVDVDAGKEEPEREEDEGVKLELVRVESRADDRDLEAFV